MSTQHTPGPWRQNGSLITAQGDFGTTIASLPCKCDAVPRFADAAARDFAERDANARLIAAAPDLLAALRQLRNSCEMPWMQTRMRGASCGNDVEIALNAARAAVAKAEGRA